MVSQTSTAEKPSPWLVDYRARQALFDSRRVTPKIERASLPFALPDIPQLHHVPKRIDAEDEAEIRYWAHGYGASTIFQSTGAFGAQLEQAECFGFGALPCRKCGGKFRVRRLPKDRQCPDCRSSLPAACRECPGCRKSFVTDWQDGTGQAPRTRLGKSGKKLTYAMALAAHRNKMQREHGIVLMSRPAPTPESGIDPVAAWQAYAAAFRAQGKRLMTDAEFRDLFPRVPEEECEPCKECGGIGVVPRRNATHGEVTAYPTGNSKQLGGRESDDAATMTRKLASGAVTIVDGKAGIHFPELERYKATERIMADVAGVAMIARIALEEYYAGDNGMTRLVELCGDGQTAAARNRQANALYDFACSCFNLCAYGAQ